MRRLRADLPNVEPNALADVLAGSRRTLVRRFIASLGRSVRAEVERLRVERAKALLSGTDLPLKAIAVQVGLCRRQGLYEAFGRCVGITPVVYRRRTRLGK